MDGWGRGLGVHRRLLAWEEDSVGECSNLLHNVVLQENTIDTSRWQLDPIQAYSVRGAYHFLINSDVPLDMTLVDDVWHQYIISKVSLFVWPLLRNRLPTKDNLVRMRVLQSDNMACVSSCGHSETTKHLFLDCDFFELWHQVWNWLGIFSVQPGEQ